MVMAQQAHDLRGNRLYAEYMEALRRHGEPEPAEPSPGHVARHCARCGEKTLFRLDPEGTWYECLQCGQYA
jgi:hypothetical protein